MRILHDFKYERPDTLDGALTLLAEHGAKARPLAGGTDVVVNMKYRSMLQVVDGCKTRESRFPAARRVPPMDRPEVVVSLAELGELVGIEIGDERVAVGPSTTMSQIVAAGLPAGAMALVDAAAIMGSPLIRNRATFGGNLVNARPAADTAVAAIAIGASLDLASASGRRTVPAEGFITAPGATVKRPDELIVVIEIPSAPGRGSAYVRQGTRRQLEIALVCAGASVDVDPESGTVGQARICLGAVGPTPLMAPRAMAAITGAKPTPENIDAAAAAARSDARPIDDFRGSAEYRLDLVEALTRRCLTAAVARATGKEVSA